MKSPWRFWLLVLGNASLVISAACSSSGDGVAQSVDPTLPEASTPMSNADAGARADAAPVIPPATSCVGDTKTSGISGCGKAGTDSCCASPNVAGGAFLRDYDGLTHNTKSYPATVSSFRLDQYEATVGRFRSFTVATLAGWSPPAGSGKHAHLNGGNGLRENATTYEAGWDTRWTASLAKSSAEWTTNLSCSAVYGTWTPDISGDEARPINCASWFEAYAFCIWDGGFLPTESEWDYAAAGGAEQRAYPWASPAGATPEIDCTFANFGGAMPPTTACVKNGANAVGSEPKGNGKWGHADLAGNLWEWTLDGSSGYAEPCVDCANLDATSKTRAIRGGGFGDDGDGVLASYSLGSPPDARDYTIGVRCARVPTGK